MAKQLATKENQIVQLQGQLTEKMRRLHDMEGQMESKDRAIYYLERDMDSRSRSLGKLRLRSTNLAALAAKQSFGATVDANQVNVDHEEQVTDDLRSAVKAAEIDRNHARKLKEV